MDLPPFDRAAVDGLALRADETIGASTYSILPFRLGATANELPAGGAVRVNAGDRLPQGADAVVPIEQVVSDSEEIAAIIEATVAGSEVERRGSQGTSGATLVAGGRRLRPFDIGLLAAAGIARVSVVRRPRVRCLLTGRGIIEAGTPSSPGSVHDADGPLLGALTERDGGVVLEIRSVTRAQTAIRDALALPGADVVLVAGSTGPGFDDHAAAALAEAGELAIHGVALRPGETAGMGRTAFGVPVFLLPGAAADCLWAYEFLAGRAIRRLGGRHPELPYRSRTMTTARKIVSEIGMTEVCPVRSAGNDGVEPTVSFADAGLAAAVGADGFVIVPEGSEGYARGATVTVHLFDEQAGSAPLTIDGSRRR